MIILRGGPGLIVRRLNIIQNIQGIICAMIVNNRRMIMVAFIMMGLGMMANPVNALTSSSSVLDASSVPAVADQLTHYPLVKSSQNRIQGSMKYCCSVGIDYNNVFIVTQQGTLFNSTLAGLATTAPQLPASTFTGTPASAFPSIPALSTTTSGINFIGDTSTPSYNYPKAGINLQCPPGFVMTSSTYIGMNIDRTLHLNATYTTYSGYTVNTPNDPVDYVLCAPLSMRCAWVTPSELNSGNKLNKVMYWHHVVDPGFAAHDPVTMNSANQLTDPNIYHPEDKGFNFCK